ncbi:MAG: TVP38/TMEM64 family protein [Ruminococcaceae bacterium]|nr:TVP38/TMEM64 family protein [Oscillospiraceae bacterium]
MVKTKLDVGRVLSAAMVALLLLSAAFVLRGWTSGSFSSTEAMRAYIASFGVLAPLVLTLIQALQVVLPVLPGWLGCIVGAALFGSAGGFWCNYIGISAGSIAAYFLARRYGVSLVRQLVPMDHYEKCAAWARNKKSYTLVLFLAILLPLAPDDFLCYYSGLAEMDARKFITIILAAKPWCILFYSVFFAQFL